MANDDYYNHGYIDPDEYGEQRGAFDGVLGFFDGISSVANSIGRTVGIVADGAEDVARGRDAIDEQQYLAASRNQDLALDMFKTERGDNVQLMWVGGAIAAAALVLLLKG